MSDDMTAPGAWIGADKAMIRAYKDGGAGWDHEPGAKPSFGWIVVSNDDAASIGFDAAGMTLRFADDDGRSRTISPVYVVGAENHGPGLTRLSLADIRYFWPSKTITGIYNHEEPLTGKFNAKTAPTASTGYTFREMVEKCLDALMETPTGFPSSSKIYDQGKLDAIDTADAPVLRNINWEFSPAGEALESVLALVGGSVSVDFSGNVIVSMPDDDHMSGALSAAEARVESKTRPGSETIAAKKPKKIRIRYRVLRERLFLKNYWQAVMVHDGLDQDGNLAHEDKRGQYLPVNDVLQDWGWGESQVRAARYYLEPFLVGSQYDMEMQGDDKAVKAKLAHCDAIKKDFYKLFRYNPGGTTSTDARAQVLPFLENLGSTTEAVSDEWQTVPIWCKDVPICKYSESSGKKVLSKAYAPENAVHIESAEEGIVRFDLDSNTCCGEPELAPQSRGEVGHSFVVKTAPDIQVYLAFLKKFQSTSAADDYYIAGGGDGYEDSWTAIPDNGITLEILDDSRYYVEYDTAGSGTYSAFNADEIDAFAEKFAEDYFRGFEREFHDIPEEYRIVGFLPEMDRLDGRVHGISIFGDSSGYRTDVRTYSQTPMNPWHRNYVDSPRSISPGMTVQTWGEGFAKRPARWNEAGYGERPRRGLLGRGPDPFPYRCGMVTQNPSVFINPRHAGLCVAWDNLFSGTGQQTPGGGGATTAARPAGGGPTDAGPGGYGLAGGGGTSKQDQRTKFSRISGHDGIRPIFDRVAKADLTWSHGRKYWEAVIVTPKRGGPSQDSNQGQTRSGPVVTGGGTGISDDSVSAITASNPAPQNQQAAPEMMGTRIWTKSPEANHDAKSGLIRDVLMVGEHRAKTSDPDGYQICAAEIDKISASHHKNDRLCGPLIDKGEALQPQPSGKWWYTEQIWDPRYKGWVYRTTVDVGVMPPPWGPTPPPGTPVPPPTGTPTPQPQPQPVPTGGGTPTPSGPGNPTPSGGGAPSPTGGATPTPSGPGAGASGGGSTPTGGGIGGPHGGPWPWPNWPLPPDQPPFGPPPDGGVVELPDEPAPNPNDVLGDGVGGAISHSDWLENPAAPDPEPTDPENPDSEDSEDQERQRRREEARRLFGKPSYKAPRGEFYNIGPAPLDFVDASDDRSALQPGHMPENWGNHCWTPGGSSMDQSPYFPGSHMNADRRYMPMRGSAYFPGTASMSDADRANYEVSAAPESFEWGSGVLGGEAFTQADQSTRFVGEQLSDLMSGLNSLLGRVGALDSGRRDDHNIGQTVAFPPGGSNAGFTTDIPFDSITSIQATASWDSGGLWITGLTQNADSTWTATVNSANAAGASDSAYVDIKGDVADTTDIDG